jgi:hypothetical protein
MLVLMFAGMNLAFSFFISGFVGIMLMSGFDAGIIGF